ncbi:hypothetical protein pipiens_001088 [Culex pipiens pipiens]|uniref:Transmembrane protein n=1 Tax=Culex pipiens pipiens TaxID=38569 RepID=A0ABD1CLB9_CULPP
MSLATFSSAARECFCFSAGEWIKLAIFRVEPVLATGRNCFRREHRSVRHRLRPETVPEGAQKEAKFEESSGNPAIVLPTEPRPEDWRQRLSIVVVVVFVACGPVCVCLCVRVRRG